MSRGWAWGLAALPPALLAIGAVVATYEPLSQTWDEPAHLAAGIELLDRGTYTYEAQHPPLARLAAALPPYLAGMRSLGTEGIFEEGAALLEAAPDYDRALALARFGTMPFLVVLLAATWAWGGMVAGPAVATGAVFFLATLPPLLGNAGLATTDVANVTTMTLALLAATWWLQRPSLPAALAFGIAAGLAVAAKFSAIPFLVVVLPALVAVRLLVGGPAPVVKVGHAALAGGVFLVALWVVYGFGFVPLLDPAEAPYPALDALVGAGGWLHDMAYAAVQAPVFPQFVESVLRGIQAVAWHNAQGHSSFLLGEVRDTGWWYFYPVAFAVRTPLPLLLLGLAGMAWMVVAGVRQRDWRLVAPPAAAAMLLVFMAGFSRINIGLRHAMVLYPMLALGAGYAAWRLAQVNWPARAVVALLLAAQATSAVLAHPDHLTYFNLLAGDRPERILINGDLDWGQDLKRLGREVRARGIEAIAVADNGSADGTRYVPGYRRLPPETPTTGWVAISIFLTVDRTCGSYGWLDAYDPVATVGSSIRLYHIEALKPETLAGTPTAPPNMNNNRCKLLWGG